jgi:hypothetical protein
MSLNMSDLKLNSLTFFPSMQSMIWNINKKSPTSPESDARKELSKRVQKTVQIPFECFLCLEPEDYALGPLMPLHPGVNGQKHPVHEACFQEILAKFESCPYCKESLTPPPRSKNRYWCC